MGNEQSTPAPRGPRNKLSKPRTNSSANASSLKIGVTPSRRNSQSEHVGISNNRYSSISVDMVTSEAAEKQPEGRAQRKRSIIFRSRSAQPKVQQLDIGSAADIDFIESPVEGWSRRNSVIEDVGAHRQYSVPVQSTRPPIRTARMSLQHVPYSQHHPRLSLVAEAPSPQPDLTKERRQSVLPQEDSSPKIADPLPARTNSDAAIYAPIRRRSLMQHGVATRNSWIEPQSRKPVPTPVRSQTDLQNYYYNPTKPASSQLVALTNLEIPEYVDTVPGQRVATPNDLEYGHIGAYRLGSLRITNGAASPAPSIEGPITAEGEDDYMSSGESRGTAQRHLQGLSQRSNTIPVSPEIIKSPWVRRTESPLRQEYIERNEPEPLTVDTQLPLPEFSLFRFTDADSPTKSLDLARNYMNDLALSPFSFEDSPPASPRLEATSKHMAVDDDLFEPDPGTPEMADFRVHKSFDSGYQGERNTSPDGIRVKGPRDPAPKPLAKADSGYSSNVSLRSFKGNQPPSVPAKEAPPTPPKPVQRAVSSTYSVASSFYSTTSDMTLKTKRSLPALPVEEEIPAQPYRQPPPVPQKQSSGQTPERMTYTPPLPQKTPHQNWAASEARPNLITKVHPSQQARSQSIPNVTPISHRFREEHKQNHSPADSEMSNSIAGSGSTSRWRSRSKSRAQSLLPPPPEPVYTVQAFRTPSEQFHIPPVSAEASRKLEERVDAFPVACFPNTERGNPAMRRTLSKETLGTIFSVGSAEWREELTYSRLQSSLPAVPAHESIPESPTPRLESNRRHTYQPLVSQIPPRKPVRQSLPPVPRHNPGLQQKIQQDFETQVTSFDNISSSLGRSPYDMAISPGTEAKRNQQEKAKSMTAQFEAEAAARFARSRSISQESQRLQRASSYDSISNQNPWTGGSSAGNSRATSREYPPQAQSNGSALPPQQSNPNLHAEQFNEENRHSFMSHISTRVKSPPPVSMQTQRKSLPAQSSKSSSHTSSQPQSQFSAPPNRLPPQPPAHSKSLISNDSEKEFYDPWAKQRDFWASRKQNALETRKSFELRKPIGSRPSFEHPGPRSESARPSMEYARPQAYALQNQTLSHHMSFDDSLPNRTHMPRQQSYGFGYRGPSEEWKNPEKEYDHTYGSYSDNNKENASSSYPNSSSNQHEEEYYDSPSQEPHVQQLLPQAMANTSTSDMLMLDRFAGGLGYGYEPGYGLVGSAGMRNGGSRKSVRESVDYGLDFSDVPVFLQRVKVQS